jgi:4-diphosphocytidyl-2-C-methyl-D-erythritol kinase
MSARRARWRSPAKVNLCLRVVGRRSDGYHLLDSIFVPIALCDTLTVTLDDVAPGRGSDVSVTCDRPGVPRDATNLAARAAIALLAAHGLGATIGIDIAKVIPPGSGLGGGSANAATILRGLDALLDLRTPAERLVAIATTLGADVPFFLTGAPARVRGIGEDVRPLAGWPPRPLVLALPPVAVSTAWAFRAYAAATPAPSAHGDEPARLAAGAEPTAELLVNDLEGVVLPAHPRIAEVKARLLDAGAPAAVMSGSGAAVVGVAASTADAERIAATLRRASPDVTAHVVTTLTGPLPVDRSSATA